ncbi:MAG TPA: 3-hydroxyacyl-CoA dehydrogenase NAD-binding domain-containing protein [Candidatus Limnocylindrales bacterium]|nr:3-hydroxyacyl-CoA dehydrogenase NAD-binding domain-containing protein [Candidatus Limnocylindrales bacterium]
MSQPPVPPAPAGALVVGVVGAGTMGAGIAQVCLAAGHEVVLHDVDEAAVARGQERIVRGLDRLAERGRLTGELRDAALARLRRAASLDALAAEADLVIEAALEDLPLKRTIFATLDRTSGPEVILATNTSALSVTRIAGGLERPGRVLGLHFFNPAPVMPLVEVVAGETTNAAVMERALGFVQGLGKTPVPCADAPGFIVNRVNRPFTLEALRLLEAGEASVEAVDAAIVGAGYPMGPFALMDLVGIDVNYAVARALYEAFDQAIRFRPSPIQAALVAVGQLGRKTGRGFYRYAQDGGQEGVAELPPLPRGETLPPPVEPLASPAAIVERIELAIINEAYHAAGEGVADPVDIDRALKLGANHPDGPFDRARQLGLRHVIESLERLEAAHGERFRVAPALRAIATI